jgi:quinol monooxygenase YgiN
MSNQTNMPPIAAVSTIRVQDFDAWKPQFDATAAVRKDVGGILGHDICRSAADPNHVFVYFVASDRAQLDRFLGDPELPARLKNAGVSDPQYFLVVPQEDHTVRGAGPHAAAMLTHDVEDYDRWKASFDAHAETRQKAGIVGHSVSRSADRPNRVAIFVQAKSREAIEGLLGSSELKAAMQKSGVTSAPEVTFLQHLDLAAQY